MVVCFVSVSDPSLPGHPLLTNKQCCLIVFSDLITVNQPPQPTFGNVAKTQGKHREFGLLKL